ncbi:MAG: hypothetical protein RL379_649 [Bacillota bacterium]|jgi:hypothetical protein
MIKKFYLVGIGLLVASCSNTSTSELSSIQTSISSATVTSTDDQSSNLSVSSNQTSSALVTLNSKWSIAMGNANVTQFYSISENLTSDLTSTKVIEVQKVFNLDGSFYGFVYEALVDGNGGWNSNRFRVGLANSTYLGFQSVEDREHGNFGDIIINALKNSLKGKAAVYSNAWEIMISANETVAAGTASETINPIADALESITTHYLSQINVE